MKAKLIMVLLCLSVVGNANAISASYRSQLENQVAHKLLMVTAHVIFIKVNAKT